jgi:adenylate cyclase
MRILYAYQGKATTFDRPLAAAVIGRPKPGITVDLDLSPDSTVSRPHARIWLENDRWWIQDLGSSGGTLVNGEEIRGEGKLPLAIGSHIRIGESELQFEPPRKPLSQSQPPAERPRPYVRALDPNATQLTDFIKKVNLSPVLPASEPIALDTMPLDATVGTRQQRLLYELLLEFGVDVPVDQLLQRAVERIVAAISSAERGAILICEPATGQLLLKAHLPPGQPSVSSTLAEHAMNCRGGFIWRRNPDMSASQIEHQMASGMYAPLLWRGETFGVVCVDNCGEGSHGFDNDDLELIVAAAQHLALAIANHNLRDDLRQNAALVERLMTNFSPAVRRRLLERARLGRLRLGGEKSEVTILASDIRGFTSTTANMDAEDVVDMLNSYFTAQVQAIFRYDGTIDKFIGDGLLAVFGSPEADERQHAKAVRAAMAIQAAISEVNAARRARGQGVCEIGVGVHCGQVLHGFIGSEERMEFTLIGDAVNRAARFCDAAAPGEVLISPELHQRVWKMVRTSPRTIQTKHEGDWPAFQLLACLEKSGSSGVKSDSIEMQAPR